MDLKITLKDNIDGQYGTAALVRYSYTTLPGTATSLEMEIDMADFTPTSWPDGNKNLISQDRIIAHEMVHAAMAASVNISTGMQDWFMEGVAEAVHGADERLAQTFSKGYTSQSLANLIGTGTSSWGGTSDDYSMAYAAVRYMDHLIDTNGGNGVKDVIDYMKSDTTRTLEDALNANAQLDSLGINNLSDFADAFRSSAPGGGVTYISSELVPYLSNPDTGSLLGSDRSGSNGNGLGAELNDSDIVDESGYGTISLNPLSSYGEVWPTSLSAASSMLSIQTGANEGQSLTVELADAQTGSLGISDINLVSLAEEAITAFDKAIEKISGFRSAFGAVQNRLEHTMNNINNAAENLTAAESRIRDVDMASEMMNQTKNSILSQAAQAMLAQANQQPQGVLQLLR